MLVDEARAAAKLSRTGHTHLQTRHWDRFEALIVEIKRALAEPISQRMESHFMVAVKGFKTHTVGVALSHLCPGINFRGCSKGYLASEWARPVVYPRLAGIDLERIKETCARIEART